MRVPLFLVGVPEVDKLRWFLVWTIRATVFVVLFGLALKNSGVVDLHFFFGQHWEIPVSLLVLLSFAVGAVLGLTAAFSRGIARSTEDSQRNGI